MLMSGRWVTVAALATSGVIEVWFNGPAVAAAKLIELWKARVIFIPLSIALTAVAVYGMAGMWRTNRTLFWILLTIFAYFTAISAGPDAVYRYFAPMAPAFVIAVAAGLSATRSVPQPS
jgi:uncharacterized membrane protein YqaE (UPF0057 family)